MIKSDSIFYNELYTFNDNAFSFVECPKCNQSVFIDESFVSDVGITNCCKVLIRVEKYVHRVLRNLGVKNFFNVCDEDGGNMTMYYLSQETFAIFRIEKGGELLHVGQWHCEDYIGYYNVIAIKERINVFERHLISQFIIGYTDLPYYRD